MNTLIVIACAFLIALTILFVIPATIDSYRKSKNRKWFNSVQIGDEYIRDNRESNPFLDQWGGVIVITDKRIGKDKLMYVKYIHKGNPYEYISDFQSLIEFSHYIPYTGQDKE